MRGCPSFVVGKLWGKVLSANGMPPQGDSGRTLRVPLGGPLPRMRVRGVSRPTGWSPRKAHARLPSGSRTQHSRVGPCAGGRGRRNAFLRTAFPTELCNSSAPHESTAAGQKASPKGLSRVCTAVTRGTLPTCTCYTAVHSQDLNPPDLGFHLHFRGLAAKTSLDQVQRSCQWVSCRAAQKW